MSFLIRVGFLALGLLVLAPERGEGSDPRAPRNLESLTPSAHGQAEAGEISALSAFFTVSPLSPLATLTPPSRLTEVDVSMEGTAGPEDLRVGLSFGGVSFVGIILEYRWGDRSVEVNVGTWSLRDLAVSVVGKQYFGPGDFRPFAGIGLWAVAAPYSRPGERAGFALLARAPVGVDWNVVADHHVGADLSLNRALSIRRKDPQDTTPPTARLVPLPGFYYVWNR
jgi:hypothetical protein